LNPKQLALIKALCGGQAIERAAKTAEVARSTAFRWMADPIFKKALEEAKTEIFTTAIGTLKTAALLASRHLVNLLGSENETTRRLTAVEILEVNFRIREAEGIEVRLSKLEKIVRSLGTRAGLSARIQGDAGEGQVS
jgi:transposase